MKFQFEGYPYSEGKDYIEIDFDFMEKSEFIRALEPDLMDPVMIPEKFEKYQIDELKFLLEKITRKEELNEDDKYLGKSKVLKPLLEYFKMEREVMEEICIEDNTYYYIQRLDCWSDCWSDCEDLTGTQRFKLLKNYRTLYKTKEEAQTGLKMKLYKLIKSKKVIILNPWGNIYKNDGTKTLHLPIRPEVTHDLGKDYFIAKYIGKYRGFDSNDYLFILQIQELELRNLHKQQKKQKYEEYEFNFFRASEDVNDVHGDVDAIIDDEPDDESELGYDDKRF